MKVATNIIHRGRYYFVIIRRYRSLLGFRIWVDKTWRQTEPLFLSKIQAAELAINIKKYLKGQYHPVSAK